MLSGGYWKPAVSIYLGKTVAATHKSLEGHSLPLLTTTTFLLYQADDIGKAKLTKLWVRPMSIAPHLCHILDVHAGLQRH
jgi:hypothetical protein